VATHRIPVAIIKPDSGCPLDLISNQITAAATPSIGDLLAYVLADGGTDEGLWIKFSVPKNYVGTPKLVIRGILDGAPSAGDDLGFGFRKRAVADNEAADGTFDAEQTVQNTDIGSTGSNYSNEDEFEMAVTLTAGDYAVDDSVYGYVYIDASGTTYTGNVLVLADDGIFFEYQDA
jgi:hypothetical protein